MGVALLDLVEKGLRTAKQALGNRAGKPESGGLPRETHIVVHCIRKEEGHTFAEIIDRLSLMPEVCDRLGLNPDAMPHPTTFYHSLDRYAMYVWRALLRVSAQQLRQSGHVALDSTFFERNQASQYYLQRRGRSVKTIKATAEISAFRVPVSDRYPEGIKYSMQYGSAKGETIIRYDNFPDHPSASRHHKHQRDGGVEDVEFDGLQALFQRFKQR